MPEPEPSTPRPVDRQALVRVLHRLHRAASAPWLHAEVARRMAERLPIVRLQPRKVLAWALQVGGGAADLRRVYPQADILRIEPETSARVEVPRAWWDPRRSAPAPVAPAAVPAGAGELLWSNMGLHGVADPLAWMRCWHAALAVDGFLMFSTLGPGSLQSLRHLYLSRGWPPPHAPFVDMHDLGDMLVQAGFADPVMDQETITLTWPDARAALKELRSLGGNVDLRRLAGLRTPRWQRRLEQAMADAVTQPDGRVALPFEIIYGHAFRPTPRLRLEPQTTVPLDDMRAMVRSGRRQDR